MRICYLCKTSIILGASEKNSLLYSCLVSNCDQVKFTLWAEPYSVSFSLCLILERADYPEWIDPNLAPELWIRFFWNASTPHPMLWGLGDTLLHTWSSQWPVLWDGMAPGLPVSQTTTKVPKWYVNSSNTMRAINSIFKEVDIFKNRLGTYINVNP